MTILKVLGGLLVSAACLIAFLAMTDEYERAAASEPSEARVLEVRDGVVRYERYDPGSQWDDDGDGWIGPYSDDGVPADAAAALSPGDPLVVRMGQLEQSLSPPTKLLLVGVVLGILLALWSLVGPLVERRAIARAQADPIRLFELMAAKTRTTKLVGAVVMLAMGAFIAVVGVLAEASTWERVFILGIAAITLPVAALMGYGAWEVRSPSRSPVVRLLRDAPEKIVWVYEHRVLVGSIASYNVWLFCDDGARFEFALQQMSPEPLLAALAQRLPRAVFGYTNERKARFERSPADFFEASRAEAA